MDENDTEMRAVRAQWQCLKDDWELSPHEEAALLGTGEIATAAGCDLRIGDAETRARLLLALAPELRIAFGSDRVVRGWLRRPLPAVSDYSPIAVLSKSPAWTRWLREVLQDIRE